MGGIQTLGVRGVEEIIALGIFLRTMFAWWVVSYWARSRYRSDVLLAASESYESDPAARAVKRGRTRSLSTSFVLRFCFGTLVILLSAAGVFQYASPVNALPLMFGLAVLTFFVNALFIAAERVSYRGLRMFLTTFGWLLATITMVAFCGSHLRFGDSGSMLRSGLQHVIGHPMPWILGLAGFFVMYPVGDWIGIFMQRWEADISPEQGLPDGGKWIGRLERLLIVLCLVAGQPAGIAILVTAKGALRFSEIRQGVDEGRQRKLIEYILIGSMLSYASALTVGWIVSGTWSLFS